MKGFTIWENQFLEQPKQPSLDIRSNFRNNLMSLVIPDGSSIPFPVAGPTWTSGYSTNIGSVGNDGSVIQTTATTGGWNTQLYSAQIVTEFTLVVRFQKTDATLRQTYLFAAADSQYRCSAHVPWDDGTTYFDFGGAVGTQRINATGLNFQAPTTLVFSAGPQGMSIIQDGIVRAANATPAYRNPTNGGWLWFASSSGGSVDLIKVYMVGIWNRAFSGPENISLSLNPWQVFQSRNAQRIWTPGPKRNV